MSEDLRQAIRKIGEQAKAAALELSALSGRKRQKAIAAMPSGLREIRSEIMKVNSEEVEAARMSGLAEPLMKRLEISGKVFQYMLDRLEKVAALPDPIGRVIEGHTRPDGLVVEKVTVPLGVIGMIYESRPNVTTDAASVCLKSGNAVILRGGSESLKTNMLLADAMIRTCRDHGLPEHAVQIIREPGHEAVGELLQLDDCMDVLIPRGGKPLIRAVSDGTRIPVIKHYEGVCHLYLAADAPVDMAVALTVNSKCQRMEVCNALEKVLIDSKSAPILLKAIARALRAQGVELRGCAKTCELDPSIAPASDEDWTAEYLAPILTVRIVDGLAEAVRHINTFGSGHTDGIVTQNVDSARRFVQAVDSASVMVNASTRLSGGGDYGLGAVVGISTDKIHARGPVGPNDLTSYKWIAYGSGHLRT